MATPDVDPRPEIAASIQAFIAKVQPKWNSLDAALQKQAIAIINKGRRDLHVESARRDFLYYVKHMWGALGIPEAYKEGEHHRKMADAFNRIAEGKLKRLIIAMPPRAGKSIFASEALPTWFLGKYPSKYVIQISNGKRLSSKFGAKVRDMFEADEYQEIFPGVRLSKSTKGKEVFNTNRKGRYVAMSMEAKMAGEGGHLIIVDDPHSEQDVVKMISNPNIWEDAWQRFIGIRQRAQKGAAIVIIATRWNSRDITGRNLRMKAEGKEDWEVIEFPAIYDEYLPTERSFWEEGKPLEDLRVERATTPTWKWNAVFQQKPMDEGANIIQREWWKDWTQYDANLEPAFTPGMFKYVVQAWDTAQSSKQLSNFSACATFGLFYATPADQQKGQYSLMLVDAMQGRWDSTVLLEKMVLMHNKWKPDQLIIESKQSGTAMIDFLRQRGIFATPFVPTRGSMKMSNDKMSRLNSISPVFQAGLVWAPKDKGWATDVIESCAMAGFGGADDLADCVTMCLKHVRDGNTLFLPREYEVRREEEEKREKLPEPELVGYW